MEIDTIDKTEYERSIIETRLTEIFEPENYIASKEAEYGDIRVRLKEIIENMMNPKSLNLNDEINEKFLELDFGSEFTINADKIGVQDAIFFVNLLNQNNTINYSVDNDTIQLSDANGKRITE